MSGRLKLLLGPTIILGPPVLTWALVDWIVRVVLAGRRDASRTALRSVPDASTRKVSG